MFKKIFYILFRNYRYRYDLKSFLVFDRHQEQYRT